jgi:DNA polymerase III epsilon subunit-like protein
MGSYYGKVQHLAVDLETTGLDPARNSICEIGAIKLGPDLKREPDAPRFHATVRPFEKAVIAPQAIAVNKHTWVNDKDSDAYKKAQTYPAALSSFRQYLETVFGPDPSFVVLVGWNISFDERFLKRLWLRGEHGKNTPVPTDEGLKQVHWPFHWHKIDLLSVCRYLDARAGRTRKSYRLEALTEHYYSHGLAKFAMHTAMGDCEMQLRVLEAVENDHPR